MPETEPYSWRNRMVASIVSRKGNFEEILEQGHLSIVEAESLLEVAVMFKQTDVIDAILDKAKETQKDWQELVVKAFYHAGTHRMLSVLEHIYEAHRDILKDADTMVTRTLAIAAFKGDAGTVDFILGTGLNVVGWEAYLSQDKDVGFNLKDPVYLANVMKRTGALNCPGVLARLGIRLGEGQFKPLMEALVKEGMAHETQVRLLKRFTTKAEIVRETFGFGKQDVWEFINDA